MVQRLNGKTALITAAGQGIGLATAELFAREGARVIATDIRIDGLAGKPVEAHKLDVLDASAIEALAREVGPIDVLFNCAGFVHAGSILEASEEDWDFAFDLNVKAMYRTIRAFLPGMLEKGLTMRRGTGTTLGQLRPYGETRDIVADISEDICSKHAAKVRSEGRDEAGRQKLASPYIHELNRPLKLVYAGLIGGDAAKTTGDDKVAAGDMGDIANVPIPIPRPTF